MDTPAESVIPLAIRFVPYDQWFVTHVSTSWKTKEVKQYILSKCLPYSSYVRSQAPEPPQPRSLSPITFASASASRSRRSLDQRSTRSASVAGDEDGDGDGSNDEEDDEDADDVFPVEHGQATRLNRDHYHSTAYATTRQPVPDASTSTAKSTRQSRSDARSVYHHSHFSLLSFSTFHLLENDYTISWYRLRPYELLEMHLSGAIVRLQRDQLLKYVEPYFECKVKALRVVYKERKHESDKDREKDKGKDESKQASSQTSSSSSSRLRSTHSDPSAVLPIRKSKIEWREKWINVRHGVLRLCKDRADTSSSQTFPLAALRNIRGSEHLQNASSSIPHQSTETIICAKFKNVAAHSYPAHSYSASSVAGGAIRSAPPLGGGGGLYNDEYGRRGSVPGPGGLGRAGRREHEHGDIAEEGDDRRHDKGAEGAWIVLDMLDEYGKCLTYQAFTSLLRILHRGAPRSVSSSFVPNMSTSSGEATARPSSRADQHRTVPSLGPLNIPAGCVPYPEWRIDLVTRARRVGMGDIGPVLEWVLLGDRVDAKGKAKEAEDWRRSGSWSVDGSVDVDAAEDDDEDSEKEWEGWMGDLERQRRERGAPRYTSGGDSDAAASALRTASASSASSPSNTLRGAPPTRVFSPPPSSFASGAHSGIGAPFADASVRPAMRMANTRTTTTSTVSVGGRVRSTTVSVGTGAAKGKSAVHSPQASRDRRGQGLKLALPFSGFGGREQDPVRYEFAPNTDDDDTPSALRHATSLENMRVPEQGWELPSISRVVHSAVSSPAVENGIPLHGHGIVKTSIQAGPSEGRVKKKSGLGLVRGMSVRAGAERLVRGLDSALDFVEGK
ncbi:hypothetical protein GLOTRDRAFT_125145 [Gloeophyllum trabeum ATCC 11539]|uniref:Uncharacterized protein n=1 Tax=Gloeophyllum trabeum (strain ATCC 11539 / FP-39264 / Madison 617) TaxID=670483 RepID=S7QHV6_GLOTA|nr:uncharacterized protein GLOTRDRAFT_125145 [Gloeophyllum trabeum ATCC 11539]EPQ58818.1 hypothetical protein GLOTRDRAFT_125145 [Gloeophyllum trabeum ATCC 11539]